MLRWCDYVLRVASPLVPHDIRRDWLREWRAEFAYTAARAAPRPDDRRILGHHRGARLWHGLQQLANQRAKDRRAPARQELVAALARRGRARIEAGHHDQAGLVGDQLGDGVVEVWQMDEVVES